MAHLLKATQVLGRWRKPKLSLRKQQTLLKQAIAPRNCQQILDGKVELTDTTKSVLVPLLTTYVSKWEGRYNGELKEFRAPKGHKFEKKLLERQEQIKKNLKQVPKMLEDLKKKKHDKPIVRKGVDWILPSRAERLRDQAQAKLRSRQNTYEHIEDALFHGADPHQARLFAAEKRK
eukprot:TRINITY_DN752_c0_g1_i1.p1 TRINITY_DN752_c0_g1~~TRINITY_DN752_c0_g1_i1.p1  ORF type:complete len:197 (+),score=79.38 TRINITY_DN752_c0_g1_i1:65-592(+)